MFVVSHAEEVAGEGDGSCGVERLAGEQHEREEALGRPHVQGDSGVDERDEGVEALVAVATGPTWSEDSCFAVCAQFQRCGQIGKERPDRRLVDVSRVVALQKEALTCDRWSEIALAARLAATCAI